MTNKLSSIRTTDSQLRVELVRADKGFDLVEALFTIAPKIVGFHLRDLIAHIVFHTRNEIFRRSALKGAKALKKRGALKTALFPFKHARKTTALKKAFANLPESNAINLASFKGFLFDSSKVVLAHEFGKRIVPRKGQFLVVPLSARLRKANKNQRQAERLSSAEEWNRANPHNPFFPIKGRRRGKGLSMLAREHRSKKKADGSPSLDRVFALRRSVNIEPRLGAHDTFAGDTAWRAQEISETQGEIIEAMIASGRLGRFSVA